MFRGRNPFNELEQFMNQLEDIQKGLPTVDNTSVDVVNKNGEIIVTVDLPGYNKKNISISAHDEYIEVTASREETTEEDGDEEIYLVNERRSSTSRIIPIPSEADISSGSAVYNNGVLTITFDVLETNKEKTDIDIE